MSVERSVSADAGAAGFTLIEVLVVLTIGALALALVPGAVGLGKRALERAAGLEQTMSDRRALGVVTGRLGAARPIFTTGEDGLAKIVFDGSGDRVSFVAEYADGPAGGGFYVANLAYSADTGGLVFSLAPFPANVGGGRQVVLMPAKGLSLRYFGFDRERGNRIWQPMWAAADRLPDLVEIGFSDTEPPLVVALRLATGHP
jgi:prepilin-type N-terminal cleavage/methylation domain-containing protein